MSTQNKIQVLNWLVLSIFLSSMTACITPGATPSVPLANQSFGEMPHPNQAASLTIGDANSNLIHRASPAAHQQGLPDGPVTPQGPTTLPQQAYTGPNTGLPYPAQWTPQGISAPYPEDEYVYQGGDGYQLTNVAQDFSIDNLDEEDTIAHYHTVDGDIEIERTNRIPIYAPRFSSTRRIDGLNQYRHQDHVYAVDSPLALDGTAQNIGQEQVKQHVSTQRNIGTRSTSLYRENQKLRDMAHQVASTEDSQRMKPQVGDLLNTKVNIKNSQEAQLSIQQQTTLTQTDEETVKEYTYDLLPYKILANNKIQTNYHYEIADGKSRLDIKKIASKQNALPGELLEFTITFKNTGDKAIGNVTIVDHLSRRLAYVDASQNCTVESEFFVNPTGKDSAILRWEITEPMNVGQSAQVTFKCRVR